MRPRFPNARYSIRRGEWDDALHPHERNRASYFAENYVPLGRGRAWWISCDEDGAVAPHISRAPHRRPHACITRSSRSRRAGKSAVFVADLLPTAAHLPLPYIMGYDLYPMDTLAFKRGFLREAVEREYLILFEHDPEIAAGLHPRTQWQVVQVETRACTWRSAQDGMRSIIAPDRCGGED